MGAGRCVLLAVLFLVEFDPIILGFKGRAIQILAISFCVTVVLSERLSLIRTCIGGVLLDLLSLEPERVTLVFEVEVDQRRWITLVQRRVLSLLVG